MDIINNYEVINYKIGDKDKYTNEYIYFECTIYYMNGKRHRDNDLPAVIYFNGDKEWYINGKNTEITINLLKFVLMEHKNGLLMENDTEIMINLLLFVLIGLWIGILMVILYVPH